jgi:hypothetical protein
MIDPDLIDPDEDGEPEEDTVIQTPCDGRARL